MSKRVIMKISYAFLRDKNKISHCVFFLIASIWIVKMLKACITEAHKINLGYFTNLDLWFSLILWSGVYGLMFLMGAGIRRLLPAYKLSASFYMIVLLLSGYFSLLIAILCGLKAETLFLQLFYGAVGVTVVFFLSKKKSLSAPPALRSGSFWQSAVLWALIILWFVQTLLLFLGHNFRPDRAPFADEGTFWVPAAQSMLANSVAQAHLAHYAGGGLHPFGVPFMSALPGLLVRSRSLQGVYFMPLISIVLMGAFLCTIRSRPWVLLFFISMLFYVFNDNHSWVGSLMYQLTYGDGLTAVFFLIVYTEILNNTDGLMLKRFISSRHIFVIGAILSMGIGLLALTKSPLASTFLVLLLLLIPLITARSSSWGMMVLRGVLFVMIALIPLVLWRVFDAKYMSATTTPIPHISYFADRMMAPNTDMLLRITKYFLVQVKRSIYTFGLSLGLIILAAQRSLWYKAMPMLTILFFITGYYAYFYFYGRPGQGDHESALRYAMLVLPAVFYSGAESFEYIFFGRQKDVEHE